MRSSRRFWRNKQGNTIVEFALVLPLFVVIMIGGFHAALLLFAASSMQYATEAGARCASVNATVCADSATTIAYAESQYSASRRNAPTFTAGNAACGKFVSGSMNYAMETGLATIDVPLSAQACFP